MTNIRMADEALAEIMSAICLSVPTHGFVVDAEGDSLDHCICGEPFPNQTSVNEHLEKYIPSWDTSVPVVSQSELMSHRGEQ